MPQACATGIPLGPSLPKRGKSLRHNSRSCPSPHRYHGKHKYTSAELDWLLNCLQGFEDVLFDFAWQVR